MRKYLIDEDFIGGYVDAGESWVQVLETALEELPPNARILTREEVWEVLISLKRTSVSVGAGYEILDELFGSEDV